MRDHTKLDAWKLADELAILVYTHTLDFPKDEIYGLRSQMRRAAVSVPSNIVEGCARTTKSDYLRFLDIALGSCRELEYQVTLAARLGYIDDDTSRLVHQKANRTNRTLFSLTQSLRRTT